MKWKSAALLAGTVIIVMLMFGIGVERSTAETVNWTNPTTYTDNSTIPAATRAQLSTEIQYRIPPGSFTAFGTATGGASVISGPYVTVGGGTSYWRARSISIADNNATSAWSPEYTFNRPFQTPAPGQLLGVQ